MYKWNQGRLFPKTGEVFWGWYDWGVIKKLKWMTALENAREAGDSDESAADHYIDCLVNPMITEEEESTPQYWVEESAIPEPGEEP